MVPYDGKYKKSELSFKVTVKKKEIGNDKVTLLGIPQNPKVNSKSKLDVSVSTSENIGKITKTYSILNVIKLDESEVEKNHMIIMLELIMMVILLSLKLANLKQR